MYSGAARLSSAHDHFSLSLERMEADQPGEYVFINAVYDSVALDETFTKVLVAKFGHNAAGSFGVRVGIECYVFSNRLEIFNGSGETILFGKPSTKSLLNFFLGNGSFHIGSIKSVSHFLDDV